MFYILLYIFILAYIAKTSVCCKYISLSHCLNVNVLSVVQTYASVVKHCSFK